MKREMQYEAEELFRAFFLLSVLGGCQLFLADRPNIGRDSDAGIDAPEKDLAEEGARAEEEAETIEAGEDEEAEGDEDSIDVSTEDETVDPLEPLEEAADVVTEKDAADTSPEADGRDAPTDEATDISERADETGPEAADMTEEEGASTTLVFVPIPAGTFTMGSPGSEPGRASDETQHSVRLIYGFEMMEHEETQSEFQALMGRNPSNFASCGSSCPVESVSWHVALDFANALSRSLGREECFRCDGSGTTGVSCSLKHGYARPQDCGGYRLPTEAEWEYAARAGTTTALHNGGLTHTDCTLDPNLDAIGWYCGNTTGATKPVRGKQANSWELFDMSGNVREWVWDWYGTYPGSVTDPSGATVGSYRANRGGSWYDNAGGCRSAVRGNRDPGDGSSGLGFRLVRTLGHDGFVRIPRGTFTMGSPSGEPGRNDDETQHTVTLTIDFEMMEHEATQGEFGALMGYNPSSNATCGASCPVEQVRWHEALKYANLLSAREGLPECFTCTGTSPDFVCGLDSAYSKPQNCRGYRLPTEAEWEYAARAGTTTALYNGGLTYTDCRFDSNLDSIGWYCWNAGGATHPVREKQANLWGLFDMSGNVWEWVWDWYGTYPGNVVDYCGPGTGLGLVNRSGSWEYWPCYCRSASRSYNSPGIRQGGLGFRLARSLVVPPPGLAWVPIPAGSFEMGCSTGDAGCDASETPQHTVDVSAFLMTETEITQAQYQAVMGGNPSGFPGCGGNCPVENLRMENARDFCAAIGGRLPSEAEWEYAARGGTTTTYYCGDADSCLDDIAWYGANSGSATHPVKMKTANVFGLFDMSGNVWEWVEDCWHTDYSSAPSTGGVWSGGDCAFNVLRGGSWGDDAGSLRLSKRRQNNLVDTPSHGFRCAL